MQRYKLSWNKNADTCNSKTGPIPQVYADSSTCPPSCGVREWCYAATGRTALHWRKVDSNGDSLADILEAIAALPPSQLWRWGVAGDLPGQGESIDYQALVALAGANQTLFGVAAARGPRPIIAYTHKPVLGPSKTAQANRKALAAARQLGMPINLSADTLPQADEKAALEIGPVVVVLPEHGPWQRYTPGGRPIVVCPAVLAPGDVTCSTCQLCAKGDRSSIVGFPAHGVKKRAMSAALNVVS